jgi:hypothetical protein
MKRAGLCDAFQCHDRGDDGCCRDCGRVLLPSDAIADGPPLVPAAVAARRPWGMSR